MHRFGDEEQFGAAGGAVPANELAEGAGAEPVFADAVCERVGAGDAGELHGGFDAS
jgi:hypothetical protein